MYSCLLLMMSFPTGAWAKKGFKAQHVILIGLDAWGSYSMEKAEMPNVRRSFPRALFIRITSSPPFSSC